jgi:hypothetical protein
MLSSSAMFPLSSKSFSTGSELRTYLICSPLNSLGFSLLTKAWTRGNLPNFHPQTSRIAPAYSFLVSNCASFWQHPLQSGSSWSNLNCPRMSQELQSKLLEKPNSLHASDENCVPKADTAWSTVANSNRSRNAGPSHPPSRAAIAPSLYVLFTMKKKFCTELGAVAQAYNASYSESWDREDHSSRPVQT